ncbi:MAG: dihydrodipicolinate reductase [Candidatus Aminicenantes bacterium]|nr:dihydrodipicolinate reductase [Candidatus Aminicenantes bacterium]NIM80694.1 dihydrodipicolinate reductase [Candidatus Aminicenantes bacterium]NIN20069.1 dihydrodipicolinate reductase [Candidatus Aminicenantes bacterium]NIN43856.1 dihydrodipicolinate reductase [Candidatus Aminicenantes bacterium]NIN86667.1 dihydrodipicolinate reductase [Candidatus Aminicenantes bacterium]
MSRIKILQIGMGPLGQKISGYILEREGLEITGAVDNDPQKIGKTLRELSAGDLDLPDIHISGSIKPVITKNKPDVAILTTVSRMEQIVNQVEEIVSFEIPVVSTCEELVFPWNTSPQLAERIDKVAKEHNVAVLGTGVNPGFLMDTLPTCLTAVCQKVNTIKITRLQDATYRRVPFQQKIGVGLTREEYERRINQGNFGHVGLRNSMEMIAHRMGWVLERYEETIEPVIVEEQIETGLLTIKKGDAAGIHQIARGYVNGQERITMIFRAAIGEPEPRDIIEIDGEPPIVSIIKGGVNGDIATCAIVINAVKQILQASPGLKTMVDLPVVSYFS